MLKKIPILILLFFISQNKILFGQSAPTYDDIYKQILPIADYTKSEYNQLKAIELIETYITENDGKLTAYDKIKIYVLAGDLMSANAKPGQGNLVKTSYYFQKACDVGGNLVTEDKLRCMHNLAVVETKFEDRLKKIIAFNHFLAWLMLLPENELKKNIILPLGAESEKNTCQKLIKSAKSKYESTTELIVKMSKEHPESESLILTYYKPGVDWVAQKYGVKITIEEKGESPQNKIIENKTQVNSAKQSFQYLDKLRYKELTKENIEIISKFLDNEEYLDAKSFQSNYPEWINQTRVCDYAYLALEHMVNGNGYAWNRLKYNLKNKDKKLEDWRAWWKVTKNMSLDDMGRKTIEQALSQPISKENQFYASNVLYSWTGWGFEMRNRVSLNDEKPESIIQEIKTWWETQKDKDIASWKKSALELKDTPKYVKINENFEVARKTKSDLFNAKRKNEFEKFQKESPELLEFIRTLDKLEYTPEGIKKALETIKINKPKLKGTTFEEELEEFEQKLLADPSLIEK